MKRFLPAPRATARLQPNGFALIELMIALVIIALLAAIATPAYRSMSSKARDARRRADIRVLSQAIHSYYIQNGRPPHSSPRTKLCIGHGNTGTCWNNSHSGDDSLDANLHQMLETIPDDPANKTSCDGDAYMYFTKTNHPDFGNSAVLIWGMEGAASPATCAPGIATDAFVNSCGRTACALVMDVPAEG